jgi:sterol 3beta-glucosyltransferase
MIPPTFSTRKPILLLTYGSRGDVEPFVALGLGLQGLGHPVRLLAPAKFEGFALELGLQFYALPGDPDELARDFTDQAGLSGPKMIASMIRHILPIAEEAYRIVLEQSHTAAMVIHSFLMTDAGHTVAHLHGIPDVSAQLFPVFLPTRHIPPVALPDLALGGAYRWVMHWLNTAIFRYGGRILFRKVQKSAPDLPDVASWPFDSRHTNPTPILFAYSRYMLPKPPDWPDYAHVTGNWNLPLPENWSPPAGLVSFLESGEAPVYFGVGSMRSQRLSRVFAVATQAIQSCGLRGVLSAPVEALPHDLDASRFFVVKNIPHDWLFPRMRFTIHHGGAGTSGAAVRSGVPNFAVPFSADQAFWAKRLHKLSLGPLAPSAGKLTADSLANAIQDALDNPVYRQNASRLGEQVRSEDGVERAIEEINKYLV